MPDFSTPPTWQAGFWKIVKALRYFKQRDDEIKDDLQTARQVLIDHEQRVRTLERVISQQNIRVLAKDESEGSEYSGITQS